MQDFTRRTLRTWAVAQGTYAVAVAILVVAFVPWKTPLANTLALAYLALQASGSPGLWRGQRWGWRVSVLAGVTGLIAMLFVCGALLGSWAYLRTVFGDFGRGASLAALLFASVALQVLGLFPALQLRALLRREVRADMGAGKGLVAGLFGLVGAPLVVALVVLVRFSFSPIDPVSQEGREQTLAHLREALLGRTNEAELASLEDVPVGEGSLHVSLWHQGELEARVSARGDDMAAAVRSAAAMLAESADVDEALRRSGTLKVDRVVAVAPVASEWHPVVAMSVNPGIDGLRRCHMDVCRVMLPDDLIQQQRFGAAPLVAGIRELRLGLDATAVLEQLALDGGELERLRTESWIEHRNEAVPVIRGNTPGPHGGAGSWRRAAVEAGDFILKQLQPDGRFHYIYEPLSGEYKGSSSSSLARHAGTVYSLALLYGHTKENRYRDGAEDALDWLVERVAPRCGAARGSCIVEGKRARLGSTALTVIALLEYQRRTEEVRYEEVARSLVDFLLFMQRPDGDFHHLFDLKAQGIVEEKRQMFASEEAALALVMADEVLDTPKDTQPLIRAAERALDYLTGSKYDYFLGRFIYGADHWTCIAAEEAYPRLQARRYLDFCLGYSAFVRRIQYQPGESSPADFTGHYGFGSLMVPQAPAAAGFTEAIVSTYELSRHHEAEAPALREQISLALDAIARDQVRDDNAYLMRRPEVARGGIRRSLVEQEIRIDFTQHAASALIRGAEIGLPGD
ncbi:MAG: hypothetical protein AMS21_10650 [Gemmatimonas sp. SG8_38_2]|nr:MAG: hypothetical protein AMS21_10650 [Gemmatimonas sp. SG8_38_2]